MKIKLLLIFFMINVLVSSIAIADISLEKTASESIKHGDNLEVNIKVINSDAEEKKGVFIEEVMSGVDPIDPSEFIEFETPEGIIAWRPPILEWTIDLPSKGEEVITYIVKPKVVGDLFLGKTTAYYQGEAYLSNPVLVKVLCNEDGACEGNIGENAMNCVDCSPSSADDVCNSIKDGICDPDCAEDADPDCIKEPEIKKPEPVDTGQKIITPKDTSPEPEPKKKPTEKRSNTIYIYALIFLVILLLILYIVRKIRK